MKTETENKKSLPFFGIGRLLPFLKKYRMRFVGMIVFGLCGSAVDILIPLLQRYALDHFVAQNTLDTLVWFILLYIAAVVFAGLVNYIAFSLAFRTEVNVNRDLRNAAFKHLQTLSFSYFNQNSVGYIHARVMSDTSRWWTACGRHRISSAPLSLCLRSTQNLRRSLSLSFRL